MTTGVRPLTSPPLTASTLKSEQLEAEVLYIRLHGLRDQAYLYGDPGFFTALSIAQMQDLRLPGSLVFMEGCYGLQFAEAFLRSGARSVIGNSNPTWGRRWFLGPANIVGRNWLRNLKQGATMQDALQAALKAIKPPHSLGWSLRGQSEARL